MRIYILAIISLALSSCMTTTGSYVVGAYDKDGTEFNSNMKFTAEGSGIYSIRNALCSSHPGAIVKINDLGTGEELKGESPYQCGGKAIVFEHPFRAPNKTDFLGLEYTLAYKDIKENVAGYEFTTGNEPIDKWTTLVSLFYEKGSIMSPEEWVGRSNSQTVKPLDTRISDDHAYAQIIFNPTSQFPYFETAIKKTFHLKKCGGLVTYVYAKKYPPTEKLETIINENKAVFKSLRMDAWSPVCNIDN